MVQVDPFAQTSPSSYLKSSIPTKLNIQAKSLRKKTSIVFPTLENVLDYKKTVHDREVDSIISPLYNAIVLFDFDHDDFDGSISIVAGETIFIYGKTGQQISTKDVRDNLLITDGWVQAQRKDGAIGFVPFDFIQIQSTSASAEEESLYSTEDKLNVQSRSETSPSSAPGFPPSEQFIYPSAWSYTTMFINNSIRSSVTVLKTWLEGTGVNLRKIEDFVLNGEELASPQVLDEATESFMLPYGVSDITINESNLVPKQYSQRFSITNSSSIFGTYLIQDGPASPSWKSSTPSFEIGVANPQKLKLVSSDNKISEEFISFQVTSFFKPLCDSTKNETSTITVSRRFKDFEWLHLQLKRIFPTLLVLPHLPSKILRMDASGVEKRRSSLQRYLNRIVQHPIIRSTEVLMVFLWNSGGDFEPVSASSPVTGIPEKIISVVERDDWEIGKAQYENLIEKEQQQDIPGGDKATNFFKRVFHPGLKMPDAKSRNTVNFETHLELINEHCTGFVTAAEKSASSVEDLSARYAELSMMLSTLSSGCANDLDSTHHRLIREFSWCWRGGCKNCRDFSNKLCAVSKELKATSEHLTKHAIKDITPLVESTLEFKAQLPLYQAVCEVNHTAASKYQDMIQAPKGSSDAANAGAKNRVATIINSTLAEVDHYHTEKQRVWAKSMSSYVDGMLETHEEIVGALLRAKAVLDGKK